MRYCPDDACPYVKEYGKRSTYQDHVEKCLDCGAGLVAGEAPPPPAKEEPAPPPVELVVVGVFETLEQAQWARVALDSAGVPCFLARSSAPPDEIALQVPGAYEKEARELLEFSASEGEEVEAPPAELFEEDGEDLAADPGRCPHCGAAEFEIKKDRWAAVFVGIMGVGTPKTGERRERRCRNCGAVFTSGTEE